LTYFPVFFSALKVPDGLTLKQASFAAEYIALHGNGTRAAIAAGYSEKGASVAAVRLLGKASVKKRIERLSKRHEVTADRVLTRLDNLSVKAEESGNYPAAVRAEELIGKSLGMWVDRSVSVSLDLNGSHIEAIRALASRRIQKDTTPGDGATPIEASSPVYSGNTVNPYNVHYGKSGKSDKIVTDQGDSVNVDVNSTRSDALDADGNNI